MQIQFFGDHVEEFIRGIEKHTIAKVLRTIDLLERFGYGLGMPHSKKINAQLFELRVRGQQEVRIFYTFRQSTIVLLHGFIKKSSPIPDRELQTARQRLHTLDRI